VDVIEAEYKTLEDKIAAARDFVEVERAHHQYLSALLSQTFLDVSLVSQSLASVLAQCLALCRMVQVRPRPRLPAQRVTLRARWVTLRARWVTLRARWVTLRARWVTLRARWVTLRAR
jgi:hypothetical protein